MAAPGRGPGTRPRPAGERGGRGAAARPLGPQAGPRARPARQRTAFDPLPPRRPSLTGRAAALGLVLAVLAVLYAYPLRAWIEQRSELGALRAEQQRLAGEVQDLERARERWQDPAYVEAQARQRLRFVMPGEIGLIVLDPAAPEGADAVPESGAAAAAAGTAPWWSRLWDTVEAAASAPAPPVPAPEPASEGGSGDAPASGAGTG